MSEIKPVAWIYDYVGKDGVIQSAATLDRDIAHSKRNLRATELGSLGVQRRLQRENAELKAARIRPGVMRCAKCSFQLIRTSLNVSAGTVTSGDSKTEPCPNGCGPLWPVTWKEYAQQCDESSDRWHEILEAKIAELAAAKQQLAEIGVLREKALAYDLMFDGNTVYQNLSSDAKRYTSHSAVSATLDAMKRAYDAARTAQAATEGGE